MVHTDPVSEKLKNEFAANYMEKLFYFCLKKTGNSFEAEDLASDITLNIISALDKGTVPDCFSAWVWTLARNRYSVWAAKKHDRADCVTGADIGDYEIEDESARIEENLTNAEDLALLRRELALISSDYRDIVVAYYIDDRKVKDIAMSLGLPEGTVKSKLFRARQILKEGMKMAREFGIRSYKPEEVDFGSSGNQSRGLPWKAVERSIPKNILLEASDNPSTLEELSVELGIAMPYIEEEVALLEQATLLKKADNKYITDFFIEDKDCQMQIYLALRKLSKERSELIDAVVTDSLDKIRELGIVRNGMSDNDLKWWSVLHAVDRICDSVGRGNIYSPPVRANGETWGFIGYERVELPESVVSGHNGSTNGETTFWTYKISDYEMWERVGEMDTEQALFLRDTIEKDRGISSFTDAEMRIWKSIENRFAHVGEDGGIVSDILIISRETMREIDRILEEHLKYEEATAKFREAFDDTVAILRRNSNTILKDQLVYCAAMEFTKTRMMTVHDEVESGRLTVPEEPEKSTAAMWLEFE